MVEFYDINFLNISPQDSTKRKSAVQSDKDELLFIRKPESSHEKFFPYLSLKQTKITPPKVGNVTKPFESRTMSLMYKVPHKTNLLNVAQNHLGIQEVTEQEYSKLSQKEKQNTQMHLIGKHGELNHQWCAHTVSHLSEEAGMDIGGHKKSVQQFVDWATENKTYRPIKEQEITKNNYKQERASREKQIKQQTKSMHEGDFIIWKSSYVAQLPKGQLAQTKSSHIGIIESVNPNGTVTVIEGNANEARTDKAERELVNVSYEGVSGNQEVGEFQEANRRDGLIRKIYTPKELASFGYSGYIDNSKIVK